MKQQHNNVLIGSSGQRGDAYQIERSLRFNAADTAYLEKNLPTSNKKKYTFSFWMKKHANVPNGTNQTVVMAYLNSSISATNYAAFNFDASNKLVFTTAYTQYRKTHRAFTDVSAWYHIVIVYDSANATANDRFILYVNGVREDNWDVNTTIAQNTETGLNGSGSSGYHRIGQEVNQFKADFSLAEWHWIDNQVKTADDFGEFDINNVWQPKAYTGTYGTNGYYLNFADNSSTSALGTDTSGNGNNWTPTNFSVTAGSGNDSMTDSPTNYGDDTGAGGEVRGNYATWNYNHRSSYSAALTNGNLTVVGSTWSCGISTIGMSSGKWYCEVELTNSYYPSLGVSDIPGAYTASYLGQTVNSYSWFHYSGAGLYTAGAYTNMSAPWSSAQVAGEVVGMALDMDNGTLSYYINGVQVGGAAAFTGITAKELFFSTGGYGVTEHWNFGQKAWAYAPPSGYKALCTQNLPDPAIEEGSKHFKTITYTGNGGSQTISGLDFSPDLVWIKSRSDSDWHLLTDTVRGPTKALFSNSNQSEETPPTPLFTTFTSDGYTLQQDNTNYPGTSHNQSGSSLVAWNWKAGDGAYVSNTQGTNQASVLADPTNGFSICSYTGSETSNSSFGHGLNAAPEFVMIKNRTAVEYWMLWHKGVADYHSNNASVIFLNEGLASQAGGANANYYSGAPDSTKVYVGSSSNTNEASSPGLIAYCWHGVEGFSKFGYYQGNATTPGPFEYLGFRPAMIMMKGVGSTWWYIFDSARDPDNPVQHQVYPNEPDSEYSAVDRVNFFSNGFNVVSSTSDPNQGMRWIYAAWAEHPFKTARAR